MSDELKPCPFCDGPAFFFDGTSDGTSYDAGFTIECPNCFLEMGAYQTGKEVIDAWNRRADRPSQQREDRINV